jgi:hypothetical protein
MKSIPSDSGVVVRQAQELWSRIDGSAPNPGDYCLPPRHARIAGRPRMANRSLCEAHKERRAQFVSRSGCSGGSLPGNNHDAGIRDDPETQHEHHVGPKQGRLFHRLTHSPGREISPGFRMKNGPVSPSTSSASTTMTSAACRQAPVTCSPSRRCSTRPEGFHGEARSPAVRRVP